MDKENKEKRSKKRPLEMEANGIGSVGMSINDSISSGDFDHNNTPIRGMSTPHRSSSADNQSNKSTLERKVRRSTRRGQKKLKSFSERSGMSPSLVDPQDVALTKSFCISDNNTHLDTMETDEYNSQVDVVNNNNDISRNLLIEENDILNQVVHEENINDTLFDTSGQSMQLSVMEGSNFIRDDQMFAALNVTEIVSSGRENHLMKYPKNTFYGLPMKVQDILLQNRGISKLYNWQNDCLHLSSIFKHHNIVYSLPTSGGKTLVAEILIIKELLVEQRNAILVLPFVSIVQEKVRGLSPFAVELGFHIEEYAASKGAMPPKKRRKKRSIYIATIEKANAIINSLIELERTNELGMVVIDELHMIGDGGRRGALLEILLSKILFKFTHVQIVGMSATLGNMEEIKKFLNAEIYTNNFRPVELTEYVKIKDTVFKLDPKSETEDGFWKKSRTVSHSKTSLTSRDPDHLIPLVLEVIPENSCLVFCATKKNCESVANLLTYGLPVELRNVKSEDKKKLLKTIQNSVNGICPTLLKTIPFGIAYHHSGLTMDERKLIEDAYCLGTLVLLCCTSTLAAGVNLPAKRVILRSPYVGTKFLTRSQYKQMIGRAGRAGIDTSGESVLILSIKDKLKARALVDGPVGVCKSSLFFEDGKGLRQLILSLLGLKICSSFQEIEKFLHNTLYHIQNDTALTIWESITKEVEYLIKIGLVEKSSENDCLMTTDLGRATLKGCMDIDLVPFINKQFLQAENGLVLANELQLLYLATPMDQVNAVYINWMIYYQQVSKLNASDLKACEFIGITESLLCRKATGQTSSKTVYDEIVYKRFYLTLMLFQLLKKTTIWKVADTFKITRGFLQNLLSAATSSTFLLINFSRELSHLWAFKVLFEVLLDRLTNTSNVELAPLLDIPGVKQARARQLFKSGYHTLQDVAWADPNKLCVEIEYLPRRQAQLIISSAKMLLQEKIEILREEADEISAAPQKDLKIED